MGYLEVICGSMFSGKAEELIRRVRRWMIARKRVLVFKPSIDKRYGTNVTSHDGNNAEAQMVLGDFPAVVLNMATKLGTTASVAHGSGAERLRPVSFCLGFPSPATFWPQHLEP